MIVEGARREDVESRLQFVGLRDVDETADEGEDEQLFLCSIVETREVIDNYHCSGGIGGGGGRSFLV